MKGLTMLPLLLLAAAATCQASIFTPHNNVVKDRDTVTISSEIPIPTSTVHNVATVTETVRDVVTVTKHTVETAAPEVVVYHDDDAPREPPKGMVVSDRVLVEILLPNGTYVGTEKHNGGDKKKATLSVAITALVAASLLL